MTRRDDTGRDSVPPPPPPGPAIRSNCSQPATTTQNRNIQDLFGIYLVLVNDKYQRFSTQQYATP